ncbi:PREDICTED: uncharacterized protein LOC107334095 isoform X2 [Acropora digitifera]|uniref:uncharacterized protein LOC107334095 isoform X2 n=1 Tax=Acropora digitifera TaxID=70779 RepID=UPI00077A659B|nr:PREDICTED: uncharacterized protein LOC107334095 isoform X2 [Acropora digitifera]
MDSQSRNKESHGKRPLHPSVTTTPGRKRQKRDIPERVDNASFDRGYSSLRSYQLESSIGAQAMIQDGGVDHGTLDQGASLLTSNLLSSAMDSQSRIKGVDYATFDRGYSSLRSYQLESSMGAQALIQHGGICLSCLLGR